MAQKQSKHSEKPPAFLAVDFFCGAGGTTRGMIDAGGYVIAGIDKDAACENTFWENNLNTKLDGFAPRFLNRDIFPAARNYPDGEQEELFRNLRGLIPYYKKRAEGVPLLFAVCAPCQPFTKLSKKALTDNRRKGRKKDSGLLAEAVKFVDEFEPEMVLSENVEGIKNPKYGPIWENFREALEDLGYVTGTKIVCTSRFGIPQFRKRTILVAVRREIVKQERFMDLANTALLVPEYDPGAPTVTVKDAIGHLPPMGAGEQYPGIPNHKTRTLSELNLKRISIAKPGQANSYLYDTPEGDLSLKCQRKVRKKFKQHCFTDVYTRMAPDRPSPTITTKCHSISNGRFGHYDTKQQRGISLREAAILQSFPEHYRFHPENQIQPVATMIGNAVPPKLSEFFSRYLADSVQR